MVGTLKPSSVYSASDGGGQSAGKWSVGRLDLPRGNGSPGLGTAWPRGTSGFGGAFRRVASSSSLGLAPSADCVSCFTCP
jgi:hypothetical protein